MKVTLPTLAVALATALFSFAFDAAAQGTDGEIQGVAVDLSGAALPGVTVTIVNAETGSSRKIHTDGRGRFAAPGVPAGRYEVTAAIPGFAPRRQEGLRVPVAETVTVRFELRPAPDPETITLNELAPVIDRARSHPADVIEEAAITHLPVKTRNVLDLAATGVGVTRYLATGEMLIGGQASIANTVSVDGGELLGFSAYQFSQEAIQEFRVDANGYRAEYGRASGGVIHAITKSGTNAVHGTALAMSGASVLSNPDVESRQFGGALGGPLVRDHHFFFVNYDTLRRNRPDREQRVFLVRTDHQFTGNDHLTLRYNDQALDAGRATRSSLAGVTTIFGSRVVNDARLHYEQTRDVFAVNRLQVADAMTIVGGAHEFKGGFDVVGDDLSASMPFGTLTSTTFSSENAAAFVQDEWRAAPTVTLNVGVRHDVGSFSEWDPRLGLTWLSTPRFVVRGSYGRFSSPVTDVRVRQATGGLEYEWMPQGTIGLAFLQSNADGWDYRAMTADLHRRFWQGTRYRVAYTLSNDPSRHRVALSLAYGTDVFADRFDGVMKAVLKNWTASVVAGVQSADPRLHLTRIGYTSFDPRIARNLGLGSGRTLSFVLETYNLRNRPNVLTVNDAIFPVRTDTPEGRLTQVGVRLLF